MPFQCACDSSTGCAELAILKSGIVAKVSGLGGRLPQEQPVACQGHWQECAPPLCDDSCATEATDGLFSQYASCGSVLKEAMLAVGAT